MGVLEDLIASVGPTAAAPVADVAVGIHYTAIRSRWVGLAATHSGESCCNAPLPGWMGHLHEMAAGDLFPFLRSEHPLEKTLGLAALNSLVIAPPEAETTKDGRSLVLEHGRGRRVATVGRFPFSDALRAVAARLTVLELDPGPEDRPASDAPEVLADAEVIAVTGTTLANGTFDALEPLFPVGARVILLGPTTPMSRVLFDHRIDILAGTVVVDPEALFHAISQGASRRQLAGTSRVTLARSRRLVEV